MLHQDRQPLYGGEFRGYLADYGGALLDGWFFPLQSADGINVYRGQDGVMDYDHPAAIMGLTDTQIAMAGQDLPVNSIWHYVRRHVQKCCGLESADSNLCRIWIGPDGDMILDATNPPQNLTAEILSGGRIRLRWSYSSAGQDVAPTGFRVYLPAFEVPAGSVDEYRPVLLDGEWPRDYDHAWPLMDGWFAVHGDEVDFGVPVDAVSFAEGAGAGSSDGGPSGPGKRFYQWTSDPLTDGQLYRFAVRSYAATGGESQNTDYVIARADATGPAAITGITASWEEE